jgi:hypothetical protein
VSTPAPKPPTAYCKPQTPDPRPQTPDPRPQTRNRKQQGGYTAAAQLSRAGGVEKLVELLKRGSQRVKEAAAAALANVLTDRCVCSRARGREGGSV